MLWIKKRLRNTGLDIGINKIMFSQSKGTRSAFRMENFLSVIENIKQGSKWQTCFKNHCRVPRHTRIPLRKGKSAAVPQNIEFIVFVWVWCFGLILWDRKGCQQFQGCLELKKVEKHFVNALYHWLSDIKIICYTKKQALIQFNYLQKKRNNFD